jgi:lysophospholipase L1-like esterase
MASRAVTLNGLVVGSQPIPVVPTILVVGLGDSIMWGQTEGAAPSTGAFIALIANKIRVAQPTQIVGDINFAQPGASWALANSNPLYGHQKTLNQIATALVDPCLSLPATTKWLVLFAGTNGIYLQGNSAATEYANFLTGFNARISAGWTAANIIVPTMLPRGGALESVRISYNSLITGGAATHGYTAVDFSTDAHMGQPTSNSNTTYYLDGVHPTLAAGHPALANDIYPIMYP